MKFSSAALALEWAEEILSIREGGRSNAAMMEQIGGGAGKDKLIGGKGKDRCLGGKGKDVGKTGVVHGSSEWRLLLLGYRHAGQPGVAFVTAHWNV